MKSDFLEDFKKLIREGNYENTYKMAWAKALVELCCSVNNPTTDCIFSFDSIASKVLKYYFNQTIFFNLIQGSNPLKPPKILGITKNLIDYLASTQENFKPLFFERAERLIPPKMLEKTIQMISTVLKKDVSWRFLYFGVNTQYDLYKLNLAAKTITLEAENVAILKNNATDLFEMINYRWGMILEGFNSSPRIAKKVKISDEREIKRNSLYKYRAILDLENPKKICFSCGEAIDNDSISIDHVIPWSFLYSDDIWNLVYTCKRCNTIKNNRIPSEEDIEKLKIRNKILLDKLASENYANKITEELKYAIEHDYVTKFYIASRN